MAGEGEHPKVDNDKHYATDYNEVAEFLGAYGDGTDGDVTISADTDLGANPVKNYDNLTIDVTKNLYGSGRMVIRVRDTLTLNGIIHNNEGIIGGAGPSKGGVGGSSGGVLVIFARAISGNGTITANGGIGGNPIGFGSAVNGLGGNDGYFVSIPITGGFGGDSSTTGNGGAGSLSFGGTIKDVYGAMVSHPQSFLTSSAGEGGEGTSGGSAAGGGGGGGIIILYCPRISDSPTISATGGNGGISGAGGAGGGGGGGPTGGGSGGSQSGGTCGNGGGGSGGLFIYCANKSLSSTLTAGAVGTGGIGGANGTVGASYSCILEGTI